jgi:integrase
MRVFKPTYSKPLPDGAHIFTRKRGEHQGKRFAKFKDAQGHITQARLTKAGDKILVEVSHWHIRFEDHHGIRKQLKAYTNERATERLAGKIDELVDCRRNNRQPDEALCKWLEGLPPSVRKELIGFGLVDAERAAIGKALSEHVEEYRDYLTKKERCARYVEETVAALKTTFKSCGFITWTDISAPILKDYLDGLRDGGKGLSKRRYNALLGAAKSFCKWMVKQGKATTSPVGYLDGLDNQQTDPRHPRRVLGLNDFRRFLETALAGPERYGLTGYERNLLYRFTAETGLRSIDIRRLRVKDFSFSEQKLVLQAGRTKNKSRSTVYLRPATAAEMKQYCANKLPNAPAFCVTRKTANMVRFDLANTAVKDVNGKEIMPAIPYVDENGEYFDFHSIRHMCASLLGMNPDTPETVRQQAMRHKSPEMTRHYTHSFEDQHRQAIAALPDLNQPSRESQVAVKTGTDNMSATGEILSKSCFECAPIRSDTDASGKPSLDGVPKTLLGTNNTGESQTPTLALAWAAL